MAMPWRGLITDSCFDTTKSPTDLLICMPACRYYCVHVCAFYCMYVCRYVRTQDTLCMYASILHYGSKHKTEHLLSTHSTKNSSSRCSTTHLLSLHCPTRFEHT